MGKVAFSFKYTEHTVAKYSKFSHMLYTEVDMYLSQNQIWCFSFNCWSHFAQLIINGFHVYSCMARISCQHVHTAWSRISFCTIITIMVFFVMYTSTVSTYWLYWAEILLLSHFLHTFWCYIFSYSMCISIILNVSTFFVCLFLCHTFFGKIPCVYIRCTVIAFSAAELICVKSFIW